MEEIRLNGRNFVMKKKIMRDGKKIGLNRQKSGENREYDCGEEGFRNQKLQQQKIDRRENRAKW